MVAFLRRHFEGAFGWRGLCPLPVHTFLGMLAHWAGAGSNHFVVPLNSDCGVGGTPIGWGVGGGVCGEAFGRRGWDGGFRWRRG